MGMKSVEELQAKDFTLDIYTGTSVVDDHFVLGYTPSNWGYFYSTGVIRHSIDDIIRDHGARDPGYPLSQRDFKILTVFVSSDDSLDEDYQTLGNDIKWFANMPGYQNRYPDYYNFSQATYGVGSLEVTGLTDSLKTAAAP